MTFKNETFIMTSMNNLLKNGLADSIQTFHLPAYGQLPDTGLYLEQTARYINGCLAPLGCIEITGSMISNYVKKGLITGPVKKLYYANQIAHLICITILKQTLSLENISRLFSRQIRIYSDETAYNYFCMELGNILFFQFGLKDSVEDIGTTSSIEKKMLRSAIIAVSHIIFLNNCFQLLAEKDDI